MTAPLSTPDERRQALVARRATWRSMTLDQLLDEAAAAFGNRDYVVTDDRAWTYAQVKDWSERIAGGLRSIGIEAGDHVAVVMANFPEFVALKYAIARVGATCVPVNFLNRRDELGYVLRQSDAAALITMDSFRDLDYLAMLDELVPGWETGAGGAMFDRLQQVVVFPASGVPVRDGALPFTRLEEGEPYAGRPDPDPQAVSDILYTSGTTGSPKGAMLSHDQYLRAAFGSCYARAFDDGWRLTFSLPMYHVFGYAEGMLTVPFVGGAMVAQVQFDPAETLRAIERHRCDDVLLVPTMTRLVLDELKAATVAGRTYDLSSLRAVISSGQRSPAGMFEEIFELMEPDEVTTGYGMTEVTATTTATRPEDDRGLLYTQGIRRQVGPAGDPALGGILVDYRVVDPHSGDVLGPGQVGELRAKGPGVTRGYYGKPDETAAAFDDDGWFRSGDLGSFDGHGYMTLAGRLKETYRVGGEQVMPAEIEDVLTRHPDVVQAHVVPVPDERMGEAGCAWVVLRDGASVTTDQLVTLCAERLARFKVPKYVLEIAVEDLPTTPSGRARKFLLSEKAVEQLGLD
jgi:fatty-acyl-CoA synthase